MYFKEQAQTDHFGMLFSSAKLNFHQLVANAFKLLVPICIVILSVQMDLTARTKTEKTIGKNHAWIVKSLNEHLLSLTGSSNTVKFSFNGEYGIYNQNSEWVKEFELKKTESFSAQPDHHTSRELTVLKILKNAVLLGYRDKFDHRSFGKNLITLDSGEIMIEYRESNTSKKRENR